MQKSKGSSQVRTAIGFVMNTFNQDAAMPINFGDLEFAFSAANEGPLSAAWIHRERGEIKTADDVVDKHEHPPEGDGEWIGMPSAETLNLKHALANAFVQQHCPQLADAVQTCFVKLGGWRAFTALLVQQGYLVQWHEYERKARRIALQTWADQHSLTVTDGEVMSSSVSNEGTFGLTRAQHK